MPNFVVYKSSAGSGKTFTLVKEYLRLALHDEKKLNFNYKRILAVTFTNKAAAEMKQRVIDALDQISNKNELPPIGNELIKLLVISQEELKNRARLLLNNILHNYSDFSIGTIDSFTHKIVKTFAYDLNLPVNFNLETDINGFYEKVVYELLSKIGEDEYITSLLKNYSLGKAEDNAAWDPEKSILDFVKLLQKEDAGNYIEKLDQFTAQDLDNFKVEFKNYIQTYEKYLKNKAEEALKLTEKHHLNIADFWHGAKGPILFFSKCIDNSVNLEETKKPRLSEVIANNKWLKLESHPLNSIINPSLSSIAVELIEYIEKNFEHYSLCVLLNKQIYQLMLLKKIEDISREKKSEEQIVFISEFNQKIFELINNEPTPFIYERLGEKYHHYLLDEFQDTSGLQWQNILPLLDNSLASGWFNLIVGDGKQSIYRWRNANVKQFANLPNVENITNSPIVDERIASLDRNYKAEILDTNYRSVKTIVEFNNDLFNALSSELLNEEFARIYDKQEQKIKIDEIGYVTVNTGATEKDDLEQFNCEQIQLRINNAIASGFNYRDICIILRKKKYGPLIANYLVENNIPVVSSDSLLLKNNLEVNTIISFLNYINNNDDHISAAAVINYLFQSEQINNDQFSAALRKITSKISLFKVLNEMGIELKESDFLLKNLFDNCVRIISVLGLNKTNPLYIRFFLDEVGEFLVTKNSNLTQFTQWWNGRKEKASVIIQENTNAVKIMTIHTSKGLEFPVVIVPFCNWEQYTNDDAWVNINHPEVKLPVSVVNLSNKVGEAGLSKELEKEQQEQKLDNLNLLYVAFTRAAERLHIIAKCNSSYNKPLVSKWIDDHLIKKFGESQEYLYEIGEEKKALPHKTKGHKQYFLEPIQFNALNNSIKIKASYLKNTEESENAKKQGIILHWILSKIKTASDIDEALKNALIEGFIQSNEIISLKEKISKIITLPAITNYFEKDVNVKIEAELITSAREILRPDRIVITDEETVIIDYKTGTKNNKKYFNQMIGYQNALIEMGSHNVKKVLVYIDSEEIVEF